MKNYGRKWQNIHCRIHKGYYLCTEYTELQSMLCVRKTKLYNNNKINLNKLVVV